MRILNVMVVSLSAFSWIGNSAQAEDASDHDDLVDARALGFNSVTTLKNENDKGYVIIKCPE